jgi:hypothetical protein
MLTFRGTQLDTGTTVCLDLVEGYAEPSTVRGADWIVPRLDGRTKGNRRHDVRRIVLEGYIRGLGTDLAERQQSWREATDTVMGLMDRASNPGDLIISDGYLGLPAGATATIGARCVNFGRGDILNGQTFQKWSIELLSIDPEWVVEEAS